MNVKGILAMSLLLLSANAHAGRHAITGQVLDRNGEPVDRAIISLSPGNVEMVTDREGKFLIDYLRDNEGQRVNLLKRQQYDLEVFKVGFHVETRSFLYKRGPALIEIITLTEDTIAIQDDGKDLTESLESKPTHSAGANYEGQ